MPSEFQHLLISTTPEGVRVITLNRPEKLNAVNPALAGELPRAFAEASNDEEVRCVLITGAGRGFCAGLELDPKNISSLNKPETRSEKIDDMAWVGRWALAVTGCHVPVIAAVNGAAAGAGFGLTLAADIRVVSDTAIMTCGYARRGLSPDAGVTYFLPRLVGMGRATELILTARDIPAEEAHRIGLAAAVFPADSFAANALEYATRVAQGPTLGLIGTKRLLRQTFDYDLPGQLRAEITEIRRCFQTGDVAEAMQSFREKRKPVFKGK